MPWQKPNITTSCQRIIWHGSKCVPQQASPPKKPKAEEAAMMTADETSKALMTAMKPFVLSHKKLEAEEAVMITADANLKALVAAMGLSGLSIWTSKYEDMSIILTASANMAMRDYANVILEHAAAKA